MIGMINIPNDSPAEFYAARHYHEIYKDPTSSKINYDNDDDPKSKTIKSSRPSFMNLFNKRKTRQQITYLRDGRKLYDGQVNLQDAPKLWEQLIVRTFVHKMEDEIQSPVDQLNTIQEAFPKLSKSKSLSSSTYSLVSQERVKSECDKCTPGKLITNLKKCSKMSKSSCKLQNNSPVHEHHSHEHNDENKSRKDSLSPSDYQPSKKLSLSPSLRIIRKMSPRNSN